MDKKIRDQHPAQCVGLNAFESLEADQLLVADELDVLLESLLVGELPFRRNPPGGI